MEPNTPENEKNIVFFSAEQFKYFLEIKKNFVDLLENNPIQLIHNYYCSWLKNMEQNDLENFIAHNVLSKIEENFELDLEEEFEIPNDILNKLKDAINNVVRNKIQEDQRIKNYILYLIKLKTKILMILFILIFSLIKSKRLF